MPVTQAQSGGSTTRDRGIILLAAFVAVLPLLLRGASCGHDLDFHITNWMEVAEQWRHGILWPRWAFTPAWGAGEPRFIFYPPLSWLLGGLLALILPVRAVPAAFTFIALTACGLTMRRLAAEWTAPRCALLSAVFFIANPYMLFCVYERCAYGELLAAAWMPLLLLSILSKHISVRGIAIPVALLWLTNAPSAVMSCYLFALIVLLRLALLCRHSFEKRRIQTMVPFALRALGGMALGLALAAFYIVPAAWERRWVQIEMAIDPPLDIPNNTLFHHTWDMDHDAVLHTASCLALLLIALSIVLLFAAWRQHCRSHRSLLFLIAATTLVIAFALTPLSLFAWQHLPQLRFLQFPWRLLAFLGIFCSLLLALATRARSRTMLALTILLPLALIPPAYRQFHAVCFEEDVPANQVTAFHNGEGIDPTDEYTPRTADNDALADSTYSWWLTNNPQSLSLRPPVSPGNAQPGSIDFNLAPIFHIPPTHPNFLVLRLRNYPAWQIRVNGNAAQPLPRPDGLLAIALPPGEADVALRYRLLSDELIGSLISLIALIIFLLRRRSHHRAMNALSMPIKPSSPFMPVALPT
jgi:hypothetical protein